MSDSDNLRQQLIDSELLTAERADALLAEYRALRGDVGGEASDEFVDWLVQNAHITGFQGTAILAGQAGALNIGGYRLLDQVAPGQLGGLFHALQEEFDQPVTLKIFMSTADEEAGKEDDSELQMGREARILATSDHPNIIRSYQVGRAGDLEYVALEELKGETLADRLERDVWLPYEEACRIARDVARGLDHLHNNEIFHRDLRPETIWINEDGSAKLVDFSGATDAFAALDVDEEGHPLVSIDAVIGHYEFMPWEQALDPRLSDARSDIYSIGCVLFLCLAGRSPHQDENPVRLALKHAVESPQRISEESDAVPAPIDDTLAGMLANDPAERFQSAGDVAFALQQYLPDEQQGDQVAVVEVSDEYLEWARSQQARDEPAVHQFAAGIDPEMIAFLDSLSEKKVRRGRRPR